MQKKDFKLDQSGMGLVQSLIAVGIMSIAILGLATVYTQMTAVTNNSQANLGAQALRDSILELTKSSISCQSHLVQGQTYFPPAASVDLAFQDDDGSRIQGPSPAPNATPRPFPQFDVRISYLKVQSTGSLFDVGPDPCVPGNRMYSGQLALGLLKTTSDQQKVVGGRSFAEETVSNLVISVPNGGGPITRCSGAKSPTDLCDACLAIGGTFHFAGNPQCTIGTTAVATATPIPTPTAVAATPAPNCVTFTMAGAMPPKGNWLGTMMAPQDGPAYVRVNYSGASNNQGSPAIPCQAAGATVYDNTGAPLGSRLFLPSGTCMTVNPEVQNGIVFFNMTSGQTYTIQLGQATLQAGPGIGTGSVSLGTCP